MTTVTDPTLRSFAVHVPDEGPSRPSAAKRASVALATPAPDNTA